jgi:carbamoyltransferase
VNILGIAYDFHEASAAVIADGQVAAAAAEERFSRLKHDAAFPHQAIRFCMERANLLPAELDAVIFYEKPLAKFDRILSSQVWSFPRSLPAFLQVAPVWTGRKLHVGREIEQALFSGSPVLYGDHHASHAASAFLTCPFDRAAILTVDGVGEWASTCCGVGEGTSIRLDSEIRFPHSLGLLYGAVTDYLGFAVNADEWKVMALAAYGKPRLMDTMRRLVDVQEHGGFRLNMKYFAHARDPKTLFTQRVEQLFGFPRRTDGTLTEDHHDLACSVQTLLEEIFLRMARGIHERYRTDNLCLAGGVALNCVANGRLLQESPFRHVYVPPAPGDDGGSLGAALHAEAVLSQSPSRHPRCSAYLGPSYTDDEIARFLERENVRFDRLSPADLPAIAARSVAQGRVIGWFQGAMEFGPRALGNRSILGHPGLPGLKDRINARIKGRESFRPLAPAVAAEHVSDYFECDVHSPYMSFAVPARVGVRARIPEVLHVDGSARLQSVCREDNALFDDVIREFRRLTGLALVLNTSLNLNGEPIACSPADALQSARRGSLDEIYLGSCRVQLVEAADAAHCEKVQLCHGPA